MLDFPTTPTNNLAFTPNVDGPAFIADGAKWRLRGFTLIEKSSPIQNAPHLFFTLPTQYKAFIIEIDGMIPSASAFINAYMSQNAGTTWLPDLRFAANYATNATPSGFRGYYANVNQTAFVPHPYAVEANVVYPGMLRLFVSPGAAVQQATIMWRSVQVNIPTGNGPCQAIGCVRTNTIGRVNAMAFSCNGGILLNIYGYEILGLM